MDIHGTPNLHHLSASAPDARFLRLPRARGYRIVSLSGDVWITEQDRQDDIILRAGDAVTLESTGTAIVMALNSADIEVVPPPAPEDVSAAWIDAVEHFEEYDQAARRLRAQAFLDVAASIACNVRSLGRRIVAALGGRAVSPAPCRGAA